MPMESSSSSDTDFTPKGFDAASFRQQRSTCVPTMVKQQSKPENTLDYFALLKRAMHILQTKNCRSEVIKLPLDVKREGKKTMVNILAISETLSRDLLHIVQFILNELLTTGSVNSENKLLLKGNFIKQQIQDVLRNYINMYVVCKSCESMETCLIRENKLIFVRCRLCGSSRTVIGIKDELGSKKK